MKIRKEFNRLTGVLGDGLDKAHDVTDDFSGRMRHEAKAALKQARRSFKQRGPLLSTEEVLERHLRDNAALYLVVGLALVGWFAFRILTSEDPSEQEW